MNPDKLLVDTSAWIESFKDRLPDALKISLVDAIETGRAVTARIVILELVQGCNTVQEREKLQSRLESLEILPLTGRVWQRSYELGFLLRRKGITVPTVDLIIAGLALEHQCTVVHKDNHFELISRNSELHTITWD
jgi:hypothetical protein